MLHSRWAMLGISGLVVADIYGAQVVLVPELVTQQLLPFTLVALLMVGAVETYRGALAAKEDSSLNQRVYPGRRFNPLGLAGALFSPIQPLPCLPPCKLPWELPVAVSSVPLARCASPGDGCEQCL